MRKPCNLIKSVSAHIKEIDKIMRFSIVCDVGKEIAISMNELSAACDTAKASQQAVEGCSKCIQGR